MPAIASRAHLWACFYFQEVAVEYIGEIEMPACGSAVSYLAEVMWKVFELLACVGLAFQLRNVSGRFNEPRLLALCTFQVNV